MQSWILGPVQNTLESFQKLFFLHRTFLFHLSAQLDPHVRRENNIHCAAISLEVWNDDLTNAEAYCMSLHIFPGNRSMLIETLSSGWLGSVRARLKLPGNRSRQVTD